MSKKVLITGVAGLLGSRMAEWIINNKPDCEVIGVDNLSGGHSEYVHDEVTFYKADIEDGIEHIFQNNDIDIVYHFAAYAAEGLSPFIRKYNYTNNLLVTAEIINNCIKYNVDRLVFTSSMAVYGEGNPPFHEDNKRNPIDPYGIAKSACEQDIEVAGEQHGLDWCIIRPHNVYGINQNIWDKYRNVLGIWMYQKLNGEPFTVYGDGEQTRAFSYIDDCLEPLWKAGVDERASKEIINLGGTSQISIKDACELLSDIVGGNEIVYLEGRHEVKHAFPTYQKSIDLLDYEDKTSLEDGLTKMWEWAKNQPNRERFVWDEYEIEKRIYSYWKRDK